ncbi:MAG: aminopeptidase [Candidatus Methanomethylophilaceae archaeon]|nr:aminopeptidase [Candidatus Methanomethylophilaceae archaeon]MDD3379504.1 aminopeptidase [Candidatus Methanomethylophilaceae archaeon]MDY0224629.1 aminopeptidase [Candidatus Methanomethylophilaceae archaeon]
MDKDKSTGQKLEEKLLMKPENLGNIDNSLLDKAQEFCEPYKEFLENKTEREVVDYTIPILKKKGFKEFQPGKKYVAGERFYMNNRGKNLIMVTVGIKPVSEGLRIGVSHIDSPRLDFKPNPLFEDTDMAYFKTHYYGGIKKYQWTTIPLSLHGVVSLNNGKTVKIRIGEDPEDPSFCVTDLLPHLAQNQMKKSAPEIIEGEQLNILIGCWPYEDEKVNAKVKLNIMRILNEKYGIKEEDFLSAEFCAVPAFKPRDLGLDRSMIGAYGQDDSSCAYASLMAEIDCINPEFTTVTVFADKEETGSDGVTGMRSYFFRDFVEDFVSAYGLEVRHVLRKSICLSCDVNAAIDPAWADVFEKNNCSFLNRGPVVSKYTGSRGKYSTNDASAEVMGFLRNILDEAKITWQVGELGKVDIGGGGTIASEISVHNLDTVDMGVPVLSMHAPLEVTSKADVYMLYKAILAFYASKNVKQ